jgi:hypothetical protein
MIARPTRNKTNERVLVFLWDSNGCVMIDLLSFKISLIEPFVQEKFVGGCQKIT